MSMNKRKITSNENCNNKVPKIKSYISDRRIVSRIYEILEEDPSAELSVSVLVDRLQQRYDEYKRRKRIAFAKYVDKVYQIILNELNDDDSEEDISKSDSDSEVLYPESIETASKITSNMNSLMTQMYKQNKTTSNEQSTPDDSNRSPISAEKSKLFNFVIDREGRKPSSNVINVDDDTHSTSSSVTNTELCKQSPQKENKNQSKKKSIRYKDDDDGDAQINESKDTKKKKSKSSVEKRKKHDFDIQYSLVKFDDIGGNSNTKKDVCKLLLHLKHPVIYQVLGVAPPCGFLLHGPPGCGKTLFADAIAGETELPYLKLSATEIVSGVSGESEEKLRNVFDQAVENSPCILFLDEIDAIAPNRENASKDMERRIVSQLLTCMDELTKNPLNQVLVIGATNRPDSIDPALRRAGRFDREITLGIPDEQARLKILQVLCRKLRLNDKFGFPLLARLTPGFVGADLSSLVREAAIVAINRIFQEVELKKASKIIVKDENDLCNSVISSSEHSECIVIDDSSKADKSDQNVDSCVEIMNTENNESVCFHVKDEPDEESGSKDNLNFERMSMDCGLGPAPEADMAEKKEMENALKWLKSDAPFSIDQLNELCINMQDFHDALSLVQPSAQREGFATVPDVTWEDVGALKSVREELQMSILAPVKFSQHFKALGLTNPPGILLTGPPGCGKTLLAKAVANESGINFISVKGPELLNMYVGESERAVRQVFQRARNSSPCVIFFDEIDALCPKRSDHGESGSSARVVNQLLTEMDGLEERKQVFIMAATNRIDIIDPAVLRPGRLDKTLYVGLPAEEDREDILLTITKNGTKPSLGSDVNLHMLSKREELQGFSGADLAALVREASVCALRELMTTSGFSVTHGGMKVLMRHFEIALKKIKPSVSVKDQLQYDYMKERVS